VKTWGEVMTIY
jgi:hypothetical protein